MPILIIRLFLGTLVPPQVEIAALLRSVGILMTGVTCSTCPQASLPVEFLSNAGSFLWADL